MKTGRMAPVKGQLTDGALYTQQKGNVRAETAS